MKKIAFVMMIIFIGEVYAFKYEFQNATPYQVTLRARFESGCQESHFIIEPGKIHIIDNEKCGIVSVQGVVHTPNKNGSAQGLKAEPYQAQGKLNENEKWAIYGPLFKKQTASTSANPKMQLSDSNGKKQLNDAMQEKVLETQPAFFQIARLIE